MRTSRNVTDEDKKEQKFEIEERAGEREEQTTKGGHF